MQTLPKRSKMQNGGNVDDINVVVFTPEDSEPVTLKLGIDFELEEKIIEPMFIDFNEQSKGVFVCTEIPLEAYNDDGDIDVDQLNLLFDPDTEIDSSDEAGIKLLFGSPVQPQKRGRSRHRMNFGSNSDPEFEEIDFSPPLYHRGGPNWYEFNHSYINSNVKTVKVEAPKPDIYVLTPADCNLTTYNIMHSLSGFHTTETKTIEV